LSFFSIRSYDKNGEAWVEGRTVQCADVEVGASLRVEARMRSLEFNKDGSFSLRDGPYVQRFLDGCYPVHLSMDIQLRRIYLRFLDSVRLRKSCSSSPRPTPRHFRRHHTGPEGWPRSWPSARCGRSHRRSR
jgi:hypothetical protein